MSDPRITPDPAVARFERPAYVTDAIVNLFRSPKGPRDRQLIYGDALVHLGDADNWAYVQSSKDGYCGYVARDLIGAMPEPTHWVAAPSTNTYLEPDIKVPTMGYLTFGSSLNVEEITGDFAATSIGYVPLVHLRSLPDRFADPVAVAEGFLGTPYLWGGNSRWGIDCSGLVQAALLACGHPCPGDSDLQMALGQEAQGPYQRNDLLFWKGHVALVVDAEVMIHANAHAMAVTTEGIEVAIKRIEAAGDGPVTGHRRFLG